MLSINKRSPTLCTWSEAGLLLYMGSSPLGTPKRPWRVHSVDNCRASRYDCELSGMTMEAMGLERPPGPMAIGNDAAFCVCRCFREH